MSTLQTIATEVIAIDALTADIKQFTLQPLDGALPPFDSGSHIVVQLGLAERPCANAYSLINDAAEGVFKIAVKHDAASLGGSRHLHEAVSIGSRLMVSPPANLFRLADTLGRHVFVAGGIGITPFIAHMQALERQGGCYTLHYAFRGANSAAFGDMLEARRRDGLAQLYDTTTGKRPDLAAIVAGLAPDDHLYVCGPTSLIDAVTAAAVGRIAPERLHVERFSAQPLDDGAAFTVQLARSGATVTVDADESILAAIERQTDVAVECLCREGYCGTCETALLDGEVLHRDQYLDEADRAAQKKIMICVSRAKSRSLTLDL
ncbi:PDR/VanB family oxidoreductase [Crenobacter sp. SG2305]|uniref:PDR/VanB family oxidoreductase n=1 Tax=Crenobacter oryzisoli TaxID=3056844 RepID=UPI0025AA92B4|nr:PDR/VanB family oxidoreductase [Crenobacter sp. SG2305]MDN0084196.1 PDR/VanB family oxidoreductase [Crenobacter sp. SG2305]